MRGCLASLRRDGSSRPTGMVGSWRWRRFRRSASSVALSVTVLAIGVTLVLVSSEWASAFLPPAARRESGRAASWRTERPGQDHHLVALASSSDMAIDATASSRSSQSSPVNTAVVVCCGLALAIIATTAPANAAAVTVAGSPDLAAVWSKAASKAFSGGSAGFLAGVAQVLTFMWLRTAMNFQYFNGGNLQSSLKKLWEEGGIGRLYQGISFAIVQAPLSRFGDTAANAGVLVLMDFYFPEAPIAFKTAAASTAAALWRVFLTPIDTLKTVRQVQGEGAMKILLDRVKKGGPGELYAGAIANFAANWVGNFPYFAVFNTLSEAWAVPTDGLMRIVRNGVIGICGSVVSDTSSNSLRVLKTIRQSSTDPSMGYWEAAQSIIKKDGVLGLLGRGLETRLLVNILQGTFFTIVWKLIEESLNST